MVFPRRDASWSLAKFVALCAVTSCLVQGGAIAKTHHRKQAPAIATPVASTSSPVPTSAAPVVAVPNADTGCSYDVSSGDFSVGIQLVGDATCVHGGVGCFQDVCRYCKFRETQQSSHLLGCDGLGYKFTTPASSSADSGGTGAPAATSTPIASGAPPTGGQVVDTGCPYAVSDGDLAVGIQLVGDATCVKGGLGCFADVCRFCQFRTTAQSGHLTACKDLGVDFGGAAQPPATTAPVAAAPVTTSAPVPVTTAAPVPVTTSAPVPVTTAAPVPVTTAAPVPVTTSAPVAVTTDAPVPATSSVPTVITPAVDLATGCPYPVSEGDFAVGIQLVGDVTCASGGLGCFKDVCRFCKYKESPQSAHLPSCGDFGYPHTAAPTFAPVDINDPTDPSVDPTTGCPYPVSEGDFNVGIQLVSDPSCASGGLGCFKDVCRYCQYRKTAQSGHLMSCKDLGYDYAAGSDASEPVTDGPATVSPPTPAADSETGCPYPVSEGDYAVGIQLIGDATCATGGLGCFKDVCRFCKLRDTPQSAHLLRCSDLGYTGTPSVSTGQPSSSTLSPSPSTLTPSATEPSSATFAPADITEPQPTKPADPTDLTEPTKPTEPSDDDGSNDDSPTDSPDIYDGSNDGSAPEPAPPASDFTVPPRDDTTASPASDATVPPADATAPPAGNLTVPPADGSAAPPASDYTMPPTADSTSSPASDATESPATDSPNYGTGCPYPVSEGDYNVGIQLVGDASCVTGGLGCYKDVCRYCQFRKTPQSSHLMTCKGLGYDIGVDSDGSGSEPVTDAPSASDGNNETGCPYPVSEGDFAVGIQLVGDVTCAYGGLGCFKNVCRFCKYKESPQSAHLLSCGDFGYPHTAAPTFAPVDINDPTDPSVDPTTGCPYPVSEGDFNVGIQLVSDPSCASGGLGCFKDVCRYCQYRKTAQSGHLMSCKDLGYDYAAGSDASEPVTDAPASGSPASDIPITAKPVVPVTTAPVTSLPVVPATDAPVAPATDAPVTASPVVPATDAPATAAPVAPAPDSPVTTSPSVPAYDGSASGSSELATCPLSVSEGDAAVGIQLLTDSSCVNGGLGCVADVCRFCKFRETPQSAHLLDCAAFSHAAPAPSNGIPISQPSGTSSSGCPFNASEGDLNIGVQIISDTTCDIGGIGCFHDACRFCKFFDTDKSSHLEDCSTFGFTFEPVTTTAAPLPSDTLAPSPSTLAPAVAPTGECDQTVSEGDAKAGIGIVTDASCLVGGVGCLPDSVCRYCKVVPTAANGHMEWCSKITGVSADTPAPGSDLTTAPATDATTPPTSVSDGTTSVAPVATAAGSSTSCDQTVSEGDSKAGIDIITDASCANGGVGCLPGSTCRYCKRSESSQSAHLQWCPGSSSATGNAPPATTSAPVVVVTTAPATSDVPVVTGAPSSVPDTPAVTAAPAPAAPATDASAVCGQNVSLGDANEGIAMATDPSCVNGGTGCLPDSTCRYCKRWVTAASAHLEWCGGFDGYLPPPTNPVVAVDPALTTAPTPTLDPTSCSTEVAPGDTEAGVAAVHDEDCLNGGIGCFGGVCRFCQVFASNKSENFLPCETGVRTIAPLRAAAKVRTTSSSTKNKLDELFKRASFKWSIVGAACVGVIAVVALFGLGAKRTLTRASARRSVLADEVTTEEEENQVDAAKVSAGLSSDSDDAPADEIEV